MARAAEAALLEHRGHGPRHLDLVLGDGPRCPTLGLALVAGRWRARWNLPHRRRYLRWAGPLPGGRGVVERRWHGAARWFRCPGGWHIRLPGWAPLIVRGTEVVNRGWGVKLPAAWTGSIPRPTPTPPPAR